VSATGSSSTRCGNGKKGRNRHGDHDGNAAKHSARPGAQLKYIFPKVLSSPSSWCQCSRQSSLSQACYHLMPSSMVYGTIVRGVGNIATFPLRFDTAADPIVSTNSASIHLIQEPCDACGPANERHSISQSGGSEWLQYHVGISLATA